MMKPLSLETRCLLAIILACGVLFAGLICFDGGAIIGVLLIGAAMVLVALAVSMLGDDDDDY